MKETLRFRNKVNNHPFTNVSQTILDLESPPAGCPLKLDNKSDCDLNKLSDDIKYSACARCLKGSDSVKSGINHF